MKNIIYISGTRADYSLMTNTLKKIHEDSNLNLTVIVTGMHLMKEFGYTIEEIKKDNLNVEVIDSTYKSDERKATNYFFCDFMYKLTNYLTINKVDMILLLGDRSEALAGAITATYLGIPITHIHGGENSGHVDNKVRHAITKLSSYHFPATIESSKQIIKMGEDPNNIYTVGAPGLDNITKNTLNLTETQIHLNIPKKSEYALIIYHPVMGEEKLCTKQLNMILKVIRNLNYYPVIIYPNADAGSKSIIENIQRQGGKNISIFKNLSRELYCSAMKYAKFMIGNSSSGIIEAASFQTPVINLGTRQKNRQKSSNVIDAPFQEEKIMKAIKKINNKKFIEKMKKCKNIYGDGKASQRIVKLLKKIS